MFWSDLTVATCRKLRDTKLPVKSLAPDLSVMSSVRTVPDHHWFSFEFRVHQRKSRCPFIFCVLVRWNLDFLLCLETGMFSSCSGLSHKEFTKGDNLLSLIRGESLTGSTASVLALQTAKPLLCAFLIFLWKNHLTVYHWRDAEQVSIRLHLWFKYFFRQVTRLAKIECNFQLTVVWCPCIWSFWNTD